MILEVARLAVTPGKEKQFERGVAEAAPLFQRARGCRSMRLKRSAEEPGVYVLMVEWETLDDHTVHFRGSEDFQSWRALVGPYFAAPPSVEHLGPVETYFG